MSQTERDAPVTLITGTRKGIGRVLVEHYVRAGHRVVGCSRREPEWRLDGYRHFLADVGEKARGHDVELLPLRQAERVGERIRQHPDHA